MCKFVAADRDRIAELKKENFDVVIIHLVDFCSFGVAHLLEVEATISMSTAFMVDFMAYCKNSNIS